PPSIYTLSLHDALPISLPAQQLFHVAAAFCLACSKKVNLFRRHGGVSSFAQVYPVGSNGVGFNYTSRWPGNLPSSGQRANAEHRSEEHTSELQSRENLV